MFKRLLLLLFLIFNTNGKVKSQEVKQPTYAQLSSLTNPVRLSSLKKGNRSANMRFRKLIYWIHQYESKGVKPKVFLQNLYLEHGNILAYSNEIHVYAPVTEKMNLEAQYRLGKLYGLYTELNLELMRKGKAPTITKGKYLGEVAEVDHLIPFFLAPELENSMANLTWLAKSLNRKKSATLNNAAERRIKALGLEIGWKLKVQK